jgi:hypothetical protein
MRIPIEPVIKYEGFPELENPKNLVKKGIATTK